MEGQFHVSREELYQVQMEVKHVQDVQNNHTDRILLLEKRQADDAALKSVWNSPFPSVLAGTPQQGPVQNPSTEVFEDFDDERSQNLLGSLHLDTEDEPVRRGASRANSVRFDVSTIHGSHWAHGSRSSGEFGPARPSSGIGSHPMTERSLSHKSDGRQSSAGHSVHSAPSGRTSSLGLDTNFMIGGQDDDSPLDIPEPPPGLFLLGTVPSIIRCWLNQDFSHSALLYAVVSTGSQKSQIEFSLVKDLDLEDRIEKQSDGRCAIQLPVYLPEAVVTQPSSRANSPAPQLPTLTVSFEVLGIGQHLTTERKKSIRVFLGSNTLRAHSADLLLSRNLMTIYGDDRSKVSIPFVRPEDNNLFKNLCIANVIPEKVELKATAQTFTPLQHKFRDDSPTSDTMLKAVERKTDSSENNIHSNDMTASPGLDSMQDYSESIRFKDKDILPDNKPQPARTSNVSFQPSHRHSEDSNHNDSQDDASQNVKDVSSTGPGRRESSSGIWGSWRAGGISNNDSDASRDSGSSNSYQRAGRSGKGMKVLKPSKTSQPSRSFSGARTGTSHEAAPQQEAKEPRRKSQSNIIEGQSGLRWEAKRTADDKAVPKDLQTITNVSRSSNPIGGASAFAWMTQGKSKGASAMAE